MKDWQNCYKSLNFLKWNYDREQPRNATLHIYEIHFDTRPTAQFIKFTQHFTAIVTKITAPHIIMKPTRHTISSEYVALQDNEPHTYTELQMQSHHMAQ